MADPALRVGVQRRNSKIIRPIHIDGDIAHVILTRGYEAIIDAADIHLVEGVNWCAATTKTGHAYAVRTEYLGGRNAAILMHRVLLAAPAGSEVDHINGDGLDNRRANIRLSPIGTICTTRW